jgi:cytochrome c peroxidase
MKLQWVQTKRSPHRGSTHASLHSASITIALGMLACLHAVQAAESAQRNHQSQSFYATPFERRPSVPALTALGRKAFMDPALSASGKTSCQTCHEPTRAYGPPGDSAVASAGPDGRASGIRAVPSLTYMQTVPSFTEHFSDDDGDDSIDQGPAGGRMWDGRAASAHEQALLPLLSPFEMANSTASAVVGKLRTGTYAEGFRAAFGPHVLDHTDMALNALLLSLEVFQQSAPDFYPYTSKYDAWLRGQLQLSAIEEHGRQLFNDVNKGNCARCHPSEIRAGAFPQFTDFGYAAIGVPRNAEIPANSDPQYFDLGLCGPVRRDLINQTKYCGLFRTPSLRNVALRHVYFHNGKIHNLRDAVRFYAERDTFPERWYPRGADTTIRMYDDLPSAYRSNIDTIAPFGRGPGTGATLTAAEVDALTAFLNTLTDGFVANNSK